MTGLLIASIDYACTRAEVAEAGDPCDYCGGREVVAATVEIEVVVDGGIGLHRTDRACCGPCIAVVILDEHRGDGAPNVTLVPDEPLPEHVYDPFR